VGVVAIVAHPDDEVLGLGGTLLRHVALGHSVSVHIACTKGLRDKATRIAQAEAVAAAMGTKVTFGDASQLGYKVPTVPTGDIIYTHHAGDLNRDHRLVHEAALVAGRYASAVYTFETPSSTEWGTSPFEPQRYVAVDIDAKLALLDLYASEMREFPHPRSAAAIFALASWRGAVAGLPAAEAFHVVREKW
jgi:LmbE family N-acetylglucosaminyl deacetylase